MYTGEIIDELIEMVARAERHAGQLKTAAPEPMFEVLAPRFFFETSTTQPYLIGVA